MLAITAPHGQAPAARIAAASAAGPALAQPIVEGVRWPAVSLPVVVALDGLPPDWQAAARHGIAAWNTAGSRFWYVEADTDSPNAVRVQAATPLNECGGQWQPVACTYPFIYQFAPQHISGAAIHLDPAKLPPERQQWPREPVELDALFTHELGHALGLGSSADPSSALHPAARQAAPSADDVRELHALYGAAAGPRSPTPPTPRAPAPEAVVPPEVTLRWEPLASASGYYVQLVDAAVYDLQGGIVDVDFGYYLVDATVSVSELPLPRPLAPDRRYYWRVKARTPAGNSPWTPPITFRVEAAP